MSAATSKKEARISAWITPELRAHLQQVLDQRRKTNKTYRMADVIREALRTFLDQQEEVMGSRAHQVRTFKRHADELHQSMNKIELLNHVNLQLLSILSKILIQQTGDKIIHPQSLLNAATKAAVGEQGLAFRQQLATLVDQLDE